MGFIDNALKALRLLGGRRYTNDSLNTAQEAFDKTIDIGGLEVYTQDNAIPTSSLPFSGSSQQHSVYQSSGKNILKYWFRQRLTKSNTSTETWFFMSPIGATNGVTPQLIQEGQQKNFISPKYSVSALANANTEDTTPGYGVKLFKSTSTNSASFGNSEIVPTTDYQFDYKTGVVQFDQNAPNSNQIIYMTTYQYVGETLGTGLTIQGTGSFSRVESDTISGTIVTPTQPNITSVGTLNSVDIDGGTVDGVTLGTNADVSFGILKNGSKISGSAISTGSFGRVEATTGKVSDFYVTDDLVVTDDAQVGGVFSATGNTIHGNASTDIHTFTGNITASHNLTVGGTLTAQEFRTEYLTEQIIFESGSTSFGNTGDDIHDFIGTMKITGSLHARTPGSKMFANEIQATEGHINRLYTTQTASIAMINDVVKLGLGTSSPKAIFDLRYANSEIKMDTTFGGPHLDLVASNAPHYWRIVQDNSTQGHLEFQQSGSTAKVKIGDKGLILKELAVNTNTPTAPVHMVHTGSVIMKVEQTENNPDKNIVQLRHTGGSKSSNYYFVEGKGGNDTMFRIRGDGSIIASGSISTGDDIIPMKDNESDLGSSTKEFKDLFIDGTANIDTLSLTDDFTYGGVTFNEDSSMLSITGSSFKMKATDGSDLFTLVNNSDEIAFQVDDKVVVLGARTTTPTAVAGGLFYSGSDQWFLGYENSAPPS
tara:strand:+ start:412 stop:2538 length:2127 start_codon:yes stop_codon:yes gene_type:complete